MYTLKYLSIYYCSIIITSSLMAKGNDVSMYYTGLTLQRFNHSQIGKQFAVFAADDFWKISVVLRKISVSTSCESGSLTNRFLKKTKHLTIKEWFSIGFTYICT